MTIHPAEIPPFVRDRDFRRGTGGRWKWVLTKDLSVRFVLPLTRRRECFHGIDGDGRLWLDIWPHSIRIPMGYAWNGSSCSPDIPGVMLASCVHDALYQFSGCEDWPSTITRQVADDIFYRLANTRLRLFYLMGLSAFSSFFWARKPGDGSRVEPYHLVADNQL